MFGDSLELNRFLTQFQDLFVAIKFFDKSAVINYHDCTSADCMAEIKKYLKVKQQLLALLTGKKLLPHSRFLSESEISTRYSIHKMTAQKVLGLLEKEGWIYKKARSGSFVAPARRKGKILFLFEASYQEINRETLLLNYDLFSFYLSMHEVNSATGLGYEILFQKVDLSALPFSEPGGLKDLTLTWDDLKAVYVNRSTQLLRYAQKEFQTRDVKILFCGSTTFEKDLKLVSTNLHPEEKAIDLALRHLFEKGHRNIGLVSYDKPVGLERVKLAQKWLNKKSLVFNPECHLVRGGTSWSSETVLSWLLKLKAKKCMPTALFVTMDFLILNEVADIVKAGIRIPQDLALVGIDHDPRGLLTHPSLTSVEMPFGQFGKRSMNMLHELISGKSKLLKEQADIHLYLGEST